MYKIKAGDYTYVGSTKDFNQRKRCHKSDCKNKEIKVYQMIREAGGWDKCEMTPIEEYECEGLLQARMREEYWRREYNANMNSIKAYQTQYEMKEYYEANKDKMKEYREANKDKNKEYREANKDKIDQKHKEWLEANKDKMKEYHKKYYKDKKLSSQSSEQISNI